MRLFLISFFLFFQSLTLFAQVSDADMLDELLNFKNNLRSHVDTLCAPGMHGRGYVNNGVGIASNYIANQFKQTGLKNFTTDYKQSFGFAVNTFPGKMLVKLGNDTLKPGLDFLVGQYSKSIKGEFPVEYLEKATFLSKKKYKRFIENSPIQYFVLINLTEFNDKERKKLKKELFEYRGIADGIILLNSNKLTWGSSEFLTNIPIIEIDKKRIPTIPSKITVDIESKPFDNFTCTNVIGYTEGEIKDSFIVVSAHYDHLGRMGADTYFPGANDNASGTALLLSLAKYHSYNKSKYTMIFIAFAGEEMGLQGSRYFVENPLFDFTKIKQLVNIDIAGTGDEGITVVNADGCKAYFDKLTSINEKEKYLFKVAPRSNTQNSDHYWFTKKNVPAVFIYTMGGSKAYHDIFDTAKNLSLSKTEELFHLLVKSFK